MTTPDETCPWCQHPYDWHRLANSPDPSTCWTWCLGFDPHGGVFTQVRVAAWFEVPILFLSACACERDRFNGGVLYDHFRT